MGSFVVIIKGMFQQEQRSGRVFMGYLLGFAIMGYWMSGLLRYVADTGEPINILEPFCVVEQHYVNMLFLVLGWLLVVADAPFMKGNMYLLLYRCGRKRWNMGVLLYAFALLFSGIAGMVAVMGVHLAGYLRMMDGYTETSLLARAIPGNFIDGTLSYLQSAALFLSAITVLMVLSSFFVNRVEFDLGTEVES